jgi:uncharacterized protein with PIN domain
LSEIKFIADVMVGKLARWLRILGYDVLYSNTFDDDEIVMEAESAGRIILTRDTGLYGRRMRAQCVLIDSDDYKKQVRQVTRQFDLKAFNFLSRCLECNVLLEPIDKEDAFEKVPPFVYLSQDRFASCPSCNRVYWHGSHAEEMLRQFEDSSGDI